MKRIRNVAKGILLALSSGSLSGCMDPSFLIQFMPRPLQPAYGVPYVTPSPGSIIQPYYGSPVPQPAYGVFPVPYATPWIPFQAFPAASSQLSFPVAIALPPTAATVSILNPSVADLAGGQCYEISTQGATALEASSSLLVKPSDLCYEASGSLLVTDQQTNALYRIEHGQALKLLDEATLLKPQGVAVSTDSILISDTGHHRILKLDSQGQITVLAGNGAAGFMDGSAAQFNSPTHLVVAQDGTVFVADSGNHRIRKIDQDGVVSTVAGTGVAGFSGDGSLASNARFNTPKGLALGDNGHLFVADTGNSLIRIINLGSQEVASLSEKGYPTWGDMQILATFPGIIDLGFANNVLYVLSTDRSISYFRFPVDYPM